MHELIYSSTTVQPMTPENISALLLKSKTYNQANAITGCLLYYGDEFIQLIEGDQKTVQDLYQRIIKDPRHTDIIFLGENQIEERTFADWNMAYLNSAQNNEFDKPIFVRNMLTLSQMISGKTRGTKAFWYMAKQLLQK